MNTQSQAEDDCTLAFRCLPKEEVCEPDFDALSCDEICERYVTRGQCGFQRCAADAECRRFLTCPVLDNNGNPTTLSRDCTLNFTCDQEVELCQVESTFSPEQMCTQLCVPPP